AQEERALRLHESSLVFVSHDHEIRAEDIALMRPGGVTAKQLQISLDGQLWTTLGNYVASAPRVSIHREYQRKLDEGVAADWYAKLLDKAPAESSSAGFLRRALVALDYVFWQVESSGGKLRIAYEPADIVAAKRDGALALMLGSEGSRLIEERFEVLRVLARLGLRHLALSWAWDTPVGAPQSDTSGRGLTEYGRDLVRECNRIGVTVDVAHLARQSIWDVLATTTVPIHVAHSGAEALNPAQGRTVLLPDEMLKAVAAQGGVVGVHFMSHFVKPGRNKAVVSDLVRQLAYLTELIGSDHVACSPDYLKLDPRTWENQGLAGPAPFSYPYGLEDISGFMNVTRGMVAAGFSDKDIGNILGLSLLKLFERVRSCAAPIPKEYSPRFPGIGDATDGVTPW
ncbi:MAG TPA: membrane dipeptidase, partial [Candidatus Limnocylindria bacterium]|nr:membrane dipeptidase [Candidatus Limnocylindria bacterium]